MKQHSMTSLAAFNSQRLFIERRHGLVIIARSVADVRAALVERYGETTVALWEKGR